jgi:regulator of protease activity HflC (stomatin/prohibitin superfamily)
MNIANAVQGLATVMWLGAFGVLALVVLTVSRGQKAGMATSLLVVAVAAALSLTVAGAGLVFIEPEERGVVITSVGAGGLRPNVLEPGLHWIIPFAERVQRYRISRATYTMSATSNEGQVAGDDSIQARTKDGQVVNIDASVIYAIDPAQLLSLHITWQDRYEDNVVRPLSRGVIRDAVSQFGVEELVSTKRGELETLITGNLEAGFNGQHLILNDFVLRNISFSDEYAAAVEQKQIAEQQAQQAAFVVEQKKQEAEQARQVAQGQADAVVIASKGAADARIIQAQAEAQALQLISAALKDNPDLLTYRYIEKLAPNVQVMYLPSDQEYLIPLPTPTAPTEETVTTP